MKTVVMLCLIYCGIVGGQVMANPYVVLKVQQEEGIYSEALTWSDHSQDTLFETDNYSLDYPWVALDFSAVKYTTLGPDEEGSWTAYVWAGYHMTADTPYDLTAVAYGLSQLVCTKYDGTPVFQVLMQTGETQTWTLAATPATASQWRTKGYKVMVTQVPEPSSLIVLASTALCFVGLWRRNTL